jgi:uncharacterized membrane protein YedE/YeeE
LLGIAASLVLLTHGRVTGVSGIVGGLFLPGHDGRSFRLWFVLGLIASGIALFRVHPALLASTGAPSIGVAALAGLLVGYGTRLGSGCTSAHGICGIGRLSVRSLSATMSFIATGMLTVFVIRHLLGGAR